MRISAINSSSVSFGNAGKIKQAQKIVKNVLGSGYAVDVQSAPKTVGFMIRQPGKKGFMHVSTNMSGTNSVGLAHDFALVQKAKEAGILKVRHVTKLGL